MKKKEQWKKRSELQTGVESFSEIWQKVKNIESVTVNYDVIKTGITLNSESSYEF